MVLHQDALIQNSTEVEGLKGIIMGRKAELQQYWKPLHLRMDLHANMYLLLDVLQQSKPLGIARRFISNEPRTGVDAALSILTRNPVSWRIPFLDSEDENMEERRKIGRIERTLKGLGYDLDELFATRLQMPLWKQVGFQGLIRGMIWGKFHITTEALKYRHSPLIAEIYDSRMVYPHVDEWGLNHVIIEKDTTLGALVASYPEVYKDYLNRSNYNPATPATKLEFWSNDRGDRKGIHAALASVGSTVSSTFPSAEQTMGKDARWLTAPFFHGYTYDELPVIGVPVNGAHIQHKPPLMSSLANTLQERADLLSLDSMAWHGANSQVAEIGRSILSAVEEQVPQYNELIATIFQHLSIGTYGTWIFKTTQGEMPPFEPGIEAKVVLRPEESVQRLEPSPISPDAYRLIDILQEERQKGVLSNILQAVTPNLASGVLLQQVTSAAMNSLEPYHSGMVQFGTLMGTTVLAQLKKAAPIIGSISFDSPSPQKTSFRVEFDPLNDLDMQRHYRPTVVMKPDLPDDMTVRMTAARMALDPRRPMLSLMTVLEDILEIEDPMAEADRIWEDLAQQDPIIILEQMAMALERHGEMEMAARIRQQEFVTKFVEEARIRKITGNAPGGEGFAVPGPEAGPLALSTARDGSSAPQPAGAEGLGALGERTTV